MKEKTFQIIVLITLAVILVTVVVSSTVKKEKTALGTNRFSFMGKKVFESKPKKESILKNTSKN